MSRLRELTIAAVLATVIAGGVTAAALGSGTTAIRSSRHPVRATAIGSNTAQTVWSKFHYDSANTGYNPNETLLSTSTVHSLTRQWEFPTRNAAVLSSPAVVGKTLYVGSNGGSLYALSTSSGKKLWSFTTRGAVDSSPAVSNGIVYFGSFDQRVYAVRASDGAFVWSFNTKGRVEASPTVVNGVVYIGSNSGHVYALNARTGHKLWKFTGSPIGSPLAVVNRVVYVSTFSTFYALNAATGAKLWSFAPSSTASPPAVANGIVYVGNDNGSLYALNAKTGAELWSFVAGANVHGSGPAIANGVVYFGSIDHNVYALNASTGAKLWSFATPGGVESSPAVANGVVYVGSRGFIYALDATSGAKLWSFYTGAFVNSSPAVVNGRLYVGSDNPDIGVLAFSVPRPLITNVRFEGTASPTLTVSGSGFGGSPPQRSDNNATGCGYYTDNGDLFGNSGLRFVDLTAGWSTGCVGIILMSWSPTKVVFQFGDAYASFDHWFVTSGDRFTLILRGVRFSGTVRLHASPAR